MKKITFGTPEKFKPSDFCTGFSFKKGEVSYPVEQIEFFCNNRGCCLRLPLNSNEQIYGLGLQLKAFNLRGKKLTIKPNADPVVANGDSHAPVPFFVSTAGYGIYLDTTRNAEFYFGSSDLLTSTLEKTKEKEISVDTQKLYKTKTFGESVISIQIPSCRGIDVYIIEGKNITEVVSKYNMMSGGGCIVPEWALYAIYRCYSRYSDKDVIALAKEFRENNLAVGSIGLEPGWMTSSYSDSFLWSKERFPEPEKMVKKLQEYGMHINLWEHAFINPQAPFYNDILPYSGNYSVWGGCVPDFSIKECRKIFADYHKELIKLGIDGFKLDECDSSDITGGWSFPNMTEFPSGLDGEQYHSLFGVLYMKTILEAMDGRPCLSQVRNAGALSANYPFVLYSDLYDHKDFIRGCCTAGFSGLLWTPEVRDAQTKEDFIRRLQGNVFSVQCLINGWYCEDVPWKDLDCENEVRELLDIRNELIPMLMRSFEKYSTTGIPPIRALVSDYTDDPETYSIDDQYIFCDNLIVAPIVAGETNRKVYLPKGKWRNYFTKESVCSGWICFTGESIPVFEKM